MSQMGGWVLSSAPLDEEYWEALLRDGENGAAAPAFSQAGLWDEQEFDVAETEEAPAADEDCWKNARRLMEQGEMLNLPIVGCNRGGLLVGWNGMRGFVPTSHLLSTFSVDKHERRAELQRLVGTSLQLKIVELDREHGRFILSERATCIDERRRDELLDNLRPSDIRQGRVINLCSFGAFVGLGGFEGLVHISELAWGRVDHPSDVLKPGQSVEVYVLHVDRERERVGLSIKRLQPDPWQLAKDRYQAGQVVEGIVTHVTDFGAFVQLEEGLEGLIHVSALTEGRHPHPDLHPGDVVQEGDCVVVWVLNVDGERRRLGLKLQRVSERNTDEETRASGHAQADKEMIK